MFGKLSQWLKEYFADIKDAFYGISVALAKKSSKRLKTLGQSRRSEKMFLASVWIYPAIIFAVFYVGVNFNSILMAFQSYDYENNALYFSGFGNFSKFASDIFTDPNLSVAFGNSLVFYSLQYLLLMPVHLLVSYFIYKKIWLAETFKILLFLPSIVSGMIWVLIYKYFVERGLPSILTALGVDVSNFQPLSDPERGFGTVMIYNVWIGLAGGMLLYVGNMTNIPASLTEAGKLDGMNSAQELWYIILPMLYPLISVMFVTSIPAIFSNQANLYTFYGENANEQTQTLGYYLFIQVIGKKSSLSQYPYASAGGLLFTLVVAPLAIGLRYLLENVGPTAEERVVRGKRGEI